MTTGPRHYAEAERLLAQAFAQPDTSDTFALPSAPKGPDPVLVAAATAHATLALAAATALQHANDAETGMPADDYDAWWKIASEGPAARQRRHEADQAELAEFRAELRGAGRDIRTTDTAEWFHASVAAGCTGTCYDPDNDTILHDGAPPCPVHEPGDVVPVELRRDN